MFFIEIPNFFRDFFKTAQIIPRNAVNGDSMTAAARQIRVNTNRAARLTVAR